MSQPEQVGTIAKRVIESLQVKDFCKHWRELDDDGGDFEYCGAKLRKVGCCATKSQCFYPECYETR